MTYRVIYTGDLNYIRLVKEIVDNLEQNFPDGTPQHNNFQTSLCITAVLNDGENVDFHIYTNTRGINIYCSGGNHEERLDETS